MILDTLKLFVICLILALVMCIPVAIIYVIFFKHKVTETREAISALVNNNREKITISTHPQERKIQEKMEHASQKLKHRKLIWNIATSMLGGILIGSIIAIITAGTPEINSTLSDDEMSMHIFKYGISGAVISMIIEFIRLHMKMDTYMENAYIYSGMIPDE